MKKILLLTFFLWSTFCFAQENVAKYQHFIGLDITGLLGQPNPGVRYQLETKHLQLRVQLQYSSNSSTDTANRASTYQTFKPSIGAAWISTHDKFSFYAGCDIYETFYWNKVVNAAPASRKYTYYGISPTIGFRFPVHNRFYFGLEGRSDGAYTVDKNLKTNSTTSSFDFNLLNSYSIIVFYRI